MHDRVREQRRLGFGLASTSAPANDDEVAPAASGASTGTAISVSEQRAGRLLSPLLSPSTNPCVTPP
ncbi:hypothetical protein GGTG_05895 [Gaeumannomyces tritici R3-111a-1]|uniref:Uncharacterized protein n=1 Tax=Gaeumannomyces tritici (strain R3-111a-1) TaxID=644352 RepID=J3NX88_GAET3|nr:hypothetical protein GGTG_05895 [Gaeumannomyces tritici R3-111a-1]EJT75970.1 hypothetical protein GGTG_05895 [Gaeumannomyces tritici R3-111a-1]